MLSLAARSFNKCSSSCCCVMFCCLSWQHAHRHLVLAMKMLKSSMEKHMHHNCLFEKHLYRALWQQLHVFLKYKLWNSHDLNSYTRHNLPHQASQMIQTDFLNRPTRYGSLPTFLRDNENRSRQWKIVIQKIPSWWTMPKTLIQVRVCQWKYLVTWLAASTSIYFPLLHMK